MKSFILIDPIIIIDIKKIFKKILLNFLIFKKFF